jgi:sugar lactone lactonase YvrE
MALTVWWRKAMKIPAAMTLGFVLATPLTAHAMTLFVADLNLADTNASRILRYDGTSTTTFIDSVVGASGIAEGPDGLLYVTSYSSGTIDRYDAQTGAFVDTFVSGLGLNNQVFSPRFAPNGNLYVAEYTTGVVAYFDRSGHPLGSFTAGSSYPLGLAFGPDGNLYVGDYGENGLLNPVTISKYGLDGTPIAQPFAGGQHGIRGFDIAFGPDGNLYATAYNNNWVSEYNGTTGAFIGNPLAGSVPNYPAGLAWGPDGNFYVGFQSGAGVYRYDGSTFAGTPIIAAGFAADMVFYTSVVPEPASLAFLAVGGALGAVSLRRRARL